VPFYVDGLKTWVLHVGGAAGVAHASSPAPRSTGGKPRLRRMPDDGRVGSGFSYA